VDGTVVEAALPQRLDVCPGNRCRRPRELVRVVEQRAIGRRENRRAMVRLQRARQPGNLIRRPTGLPQKGREASSVMDQSIVAPVRSGHDDRDHLALNPRQGSRASHQLQIQRMMLMHDGGMNRVDLDDVIRVGHAIGRIELGL
jgi:hypothetical protein